MTPADRAAAEYREHDPAGAKGDDKSSKEEEKEGRRKQAEGEQEEEREGADAGEGAGPKDRDGAREELPKWAQRTIFAVSLGILLGMVAYIAWAEVEERAPADITVTVEGIQGTGPEARVVVVIQNEGEATAQQVYVDVTLEHPDGSETISIDASYLGSGDLVTYHLRFQNDPRAGEITFRVAYRS